MWLDTGMTTTTATARREESGLYSIDIADGTTFITRRGETINVATAEFNSGCVSIWARRMRKNGNGFTDAVYIYTVGVDIARDSLPTEFAAVINACEAEWLNEVES